MVIMVPSSITMRMISLNSSRHGLLTHFQPCSNSTTSTPIKPNRGPDPPTCTHNQHNHAIILWHVL